MASLCLFSRTILQPSAFQRRKSPSVVPRGWQTCQRICGPATEPDTQPLSPVHPCLTRSMRKVHSSDKRAVESSQGQLSRQDFSPHKSACRGCSIKAPPLTDIHHAQRYQNLVPMTTLLQTLYINVCAHPRSCVCDPLCTQSPRDARK